MKKRTLWLGLSFLLVAALVLTGCPAPAVEEEAVEEEAVEEEAVEEDLSLPSDVVAGKLAPDFQLSNLDGQSISLSDFRGKPVIVNFWTCGTGVSDMPLMQEVYEEWSDQGLVILAINQGESPSTVEEFVQKHNLSFTVLLDTKRDVGQRYWIWRTPTTFFIDKDGIIQHKVSPAFQTKTAIEDKLSKIMP